MPQPTKPIKLVIADVDGTLVTHDKILTQRAIDSVMKMRDAGIQFAITSGRPPKGMAMLVEPLKLNEPIAAFNGGVVIKPDLKTVLQQNVSATRRREKSREADPRSQTRRLDLHRQRLVRPRRQTPLTSRANNGP